MNRLESPKWDSWSRIQIPHWVLPKVSRPLHADEFQTGGCRHVWQGGILSQFKVSVLIGNLRSVESVFCSPGRATAHPRCAPAGLGRGTSTSARLAGQSLTSSTSSFMSTRTMLTWNWKLKLLISRLCILFLCDLLALWGTLYLATHALLLICFF